MFSMEKIPIVGSLFDSGEERAAREQFERNAQRARDMKPQVAMSYANAMGNQMKAYTPTNNYLGAMLGDEYKIDLDSAARSPVTPGMLASQEEHRPGFAQRGADFITSFDPAMGNAITGALGGFGLT